MPTGTPPRTARFRPYTLLTLFCLAAIATSTQAIDVVIFNDGFSVQGRRFREREVVTDKTNSVSVEIPAVRGFDIVETGPKYFIFSHTSKQVGKVFDKIPEEKQLRAYTREVFPKDFTPLPAFGELNITEYDKNWRRTIKVSTGNGNWHLIEQKIKSISPKAIIAPSVTHRWYPYYDTREMDPNEVRRLLLSHPDLEENGKPDATKRLALAQFLLDAGWLPLARKEIEKAKTDIPGSWSKENSERLDKFMHELAVAETKLLVEALDVAMGAGRYDASRELIARFDEKSADAVLLKRFTEMKAGFEFVHPRFETATRLLRATLDEITSGRTSTSMAAVIGGGCVPGLRIKLQNENETAVVDAAEQVLQELHPDTSDRIDSFRLLALDREKQRAAGKSGTTPMELLSLAVSGWVLGKNGADKSVEMSAKYWSWREGLLAYQRGKTLNERRIVARTTLGLNGKDPIDPELMAQIISYLPPPEPENLAQRTGKPVSPGINLVKGIYKYNTGSLPQSGAGVDYLVRLPAEYHHGRPYPTMIALTHITMPAEEMLTLLAPYADRAGYILAAPIWCTSFDPEYDWSGDQHYKVQAVLRSLLKQFRVDNDRVFLFGFAQGGNFALDMAAAHPDLFAGVSAMAATPKVQNMLMVYYRNLQKLPVYTTIGMLSGNSFENLRRWYEFMMPMGYPAVASVYRGRGTEWFAAEVPIIFDWMGRKKRVTGLGALRLNETRRVEPWQTMRLEDNRFYWLGTEDIVPGKLLSNKPETRGILPANFYGDIDKSNGNLIRIRSQGVNNITVWLDRNMIDWSKPVRFVINDGPPQGYRAQVLQPDMELMLEQLYEHGDRSNLYLKKMTFKTIP